MLSLRNAIGTWSQPRGLTDKTCTATFLKIVITALCESECFNLPSTPLLVPKSHALMTRVLASPFQNTTLKRYCSNSQPTWSPKTTRTWWSEIPMSHYSSHLKCLVCIAITTHLTALSCEGTWRTLDWCAVELKCLTWKLRRWGLTMSNCLKRICWEQKIGQLPIGLYWVKMQPSVEPLCSTWRELRLKSKTIRRITRRLSIKPRSSRTRSLPWWKSWHLIKPSIIHLQKRQSTPPTPPVPQVFVKVTTRR